MLELSKLGGELSEVISEISRRYENDKQIEDATCDVNFWKCSIDDITTDDIEDTENDLGGIDEYLEHCNKYRKEIANADNKKLFEELKTKVNEILAYNNRDLALTMLEGLYVIDTEMIQDHNLDEVISEYLG